MKPRWKIIVEFIASTVVMIFGGIIAAEWVDGAPIWYALGFVAIWRGLNGMERAWREL